MDGKSTRLAPKGVYDYSYVTMAKQLPEHIPAGKFKATCLALLDRVRTTGEEFVITKRGVPVAKLVPVEPADEADLAGSVLHEEDLVAPLDEEWEAAR